MTAKLFVDFVLRHTLPSRARANGPEVTHDLIKNHPFVTEAPAEGAGERGAPLTFTPFRDELREAQAALEPFSFIAERRSLSPATTVHLVHLDGTHIETLEVNSFWRARHAHSALRALSSAPEAREGGAVERIADGLAHLVAAISLLNRAEEIGKKPSMATGSKKMFDQMLRDYEGAANRMRKAIYTRPAAPSADKLRTALSKIRDGMVASRDCISVDDWIELADEALSTPDALKGDAKP